MDQISEIKDDVYVVRLLISMFIGTPCISLHIITGKFSQICFIIFIYFSVPMVKDWVVQDLKRKNQNLSIYIYIYAELIRPQGRFRDAQNYKKLYQKAFDFCEISKVHKILFENLQTFLVIVFTDQ